MKPKQLPNGAAELAEEHFAVNTTLPRFFIHGTTVTWALLGALSAIPAMFSAMMFDAPGASSNAATIALFLALISFPFVCLVAMFESQSRRRKGGLRSACLWSCLPMVNLVVGGIALAWITYMQGGRFAG
jgi:hypothetical protein